MTVDLEGANSRPANGPPPSAEPPDGPGVDRAAAFATGAPKVPRRVVFWAVLAVVVLGLGGTVADHFLGAGTGGPTATSTTVPATTVPAPAVDPGRAPVGGGQVQASLAAFMDLVSLGSKPAPPFTLTDAANGASVSLGDLRGHVVVLTFANAGCNDMCPVLAAELAQAHADLASGAVPVTFVTVNSDPLHTTAAAAGPVLTQPTLAAMGGWRFLTGPLDRLNPVWKAYGESITADPTTGVATHNDIMYFVRPNGTLAWSATPFANESTSGVFSLPASQITRFAAGIATYADQLTGAR